MKDKYRTARIDDGGLHVNCKKATYYFSTALERRLSFREVILLRLHLLICASCRRFRRQWKMLQKSLMSSERLPQLKGLSENQKMQLEEIIKREKDA